MSSSPAHDGSGYKSLWRRVASPRILVALAAISFTAFTAKRSSSLLFEPLTVGTMNLGHRAVMAPMTRYRASDDHVPNPLAQDYYAQRAHTPGTLIITEGTYIDDRAGGQPSAPGIWNQEQIVAWKAVRLMLTRSILHTNH